MWSFFVCFFFFGNDFTEAQGIFIHEGHILLVLFSSGYLQCHYLKKSPHTFGCILHFHLCHCYIWAESPKMSFQRSSGYIWHINYVHKKQSLRGQDLKSPYSSTSDSLNVILISQSLFELLLFTLCCPPLVFYIHSSTMLRNKWMKHIQSLF